MRTLAPGLAVAWSLDLALYAHRPSWKAAYREGRSDEARRWKDQSNITLEQMWIILDKLEYLEYKCEDPYVYDQSAKEIIWEKLRNKE